MWPLASCTARCQPKRKNRMAPLMLPTIRRTLRGMASAKNSNKKGSPRQKRSALSSGKQVLNVHNNRQRSRCDDIARQFAAGIYGAGGELLRRNHYTSTPAQFRRSCSQPFQSVDTNLDIRLSGGVVRNQSGPIHKHPAINVSSGLACPFRRELNVDSGRHCNFVEGQHGNRPQTPF